MKMKTASMTSLLLECELLGFAFMCVLMCEDVQVCTYACMHMCAVLKGQPWLSFLRCFHLRFETESLIGLEFHQCASQVDQ